MINVKILSLVTGAGTSERRVRFRAERWISQAFGVLPDPTHGELGEILYSSYMTLEQIELRALIKGLMVNLSPQPPD